MLVLAVSVFVSLKIVFGENTGTVTPSLVGLSAVEAANQLQSAGLTARIDQVDSSYPEGTVIAQSIAPGEKTDRGKIVTLRVSRGGTQIRIPDVRGKEFAAAANELDSAGFKIGAIIRVSDQLKQPGTVIAQNPASPAMVTNSRMVDLLVSEGGVERAETVQVPNLRGQNETQARQTIEQLDLEVSRIITIESNQSPPGIVVRTDPKAGTRVPAGRAIIVYISRVPDPSAPVATPAPAPPKPQIDDPPTMAVSPGSSPREGQATEIPTWNPNQSPQVQTRPQTPNGTTHPPVAQNPQTPPPQPVQALPPAPVAPAAGKVAKIRYQVPPLARPLNLRILMNDQSGTRALREQQVKGGEYISLDAQYAGNAAVTVILGDQQVWQEKYN
jgi:serine/threonine-protein kinase